MAGMSSAPEASDIAAFLCANPSFLAERPELYCSLTPPRRVHGERLADHLAAMVDAERARAAALAQQADVVLEAGRAAAGITERVQEAVLALLRASDPIDCVGVEIPPLLGVDAASLCTEGYRPGFRPLPPGMMQRLLGSRDVVVRARPTDTVLLHAEAAMLATEDALIRIPAARPALLALVSREPQALPAAQGARALGFLGRVLAALLDR